MAANGRFKLDWRKKALAFRVLDAMPMGHRVYYQVQKRVTRSVPRVFSTRDMKWCAEHLVVIRRQHGDDLSSAQLFEFGAGWDLLRNLVLWCCGIEHQTVYDLRP